MITRRKTHKDFCPNYVQEFGLCIITPTLHRTRISIEYHIFLAVVRIGRKTSRTNERRGMRYGQATAQKQPSFIIVVQCLSI
jgi:hypothetical protein